MWNTKNDGAFDMQASLWCSHRSGVRTREPPPALTNTPGRVREAPRRSPSIAIKQTLIYLTLRATILRKENAGNNSYVDEIALGNRCDERLD